MQLEWGFFCAELHRLSLGKESKENAWMDAQSVLGSAMTTRDEGHGFNDSPKAQHLQQCCVPCALRQGADSVLTQREESHLPESPPPSIFL